MSELEETTTPPTGEESKRVDPVIVIMDNAESKTECMDPTPTTTSQMTSYSPFFINDNKWTEPASRMLLTLYVEKEAKFNDPHMKKKQVWGEISDVLRSKGYMFDADKCERKFLNLKTVYRNTVHHNSLVRNFDRKCSFFDELEEIFHLSKKSKENLHSGGGDSKDFVTVTSSSQNRPVPVRMFHASEKSPYTVNQPIQNGSNTLPSSPSLQMNNSVRPQTIRSPMSNRDTNFIQRQNLNTHLRQNFVNRGIAQASPTGRLQSPVSPATPTVGNHQRTPTHRRPSHDDSYTESTSSDTAVIDLCRETTNSQKRTGSDVTGSSVKRQRPNDLQSLLESFETYRREQREREDQRMKVMKEMHEDEMRVTNRYLDIIQQCVQASQTE